MSIEQTAHNISALKVIKCDDVSTTVSYCFCCCRIIVYFCSDCFFFFFFFFFWGGGGVGGQGGPCCCYSVLCIISSFATVWMRKSELVVCFNCLLYVM